MIFIFANVLFFVMICLIYMNFRESSILNITKDVEQKVKMFMKIREVPKVRILNISKDVAQQLMFSMVYGRGGRAGNLKL